jgi:predicted nicotinamide N-methyase
LHIWEAGIELSRFLYFNTEILKDKDVLDLGTGVGIVGITAMKYGKAKTVTISDYKEEILNNAISNAKKNKVWKDNVTSGLLLDWKDYEKLNKKYDIMVGSDVIYAGSPVHELAKLIERGLNKGGSAYILIPDQRFYAVEFFKAIESIGKFDVEKIALDDQKYLESPLADEKEGFKHFAGIKELKFFVYRFTKNSD